MPKLIHNPSTLAHIRQNFVELSGRFDLVRDTDTYADNGANFFIQAANRWLDSRQENPTQTKSYRKDLLPGGYKLDIENVRSLLEVWVTDAAGERLKLVKRTQTYMRQNYKPIPEDNSRGTPAEWCPLFNQLAYQQKSQTPSSHSDFAYDYHDVLFGLSDQYRSILLMPPADQKYTVTVYGHFFGKLTSDSDSTYWSREHPDLLIQATFLMVEMFYRNTQGVADMLNAITPALSGLDRQLIAEDTYEINRIFG